MAILKEAGWRPGRRQDLRKWQRDLDRLEMDMHAAARRFLEEFGGIAINQRGSGIRTAREPFVIDPTLCIGLERWIKNFESATTGSLYPVGEAGSGGEGTLVASPDGEILMLTEDGDGELIVTIGCGVNAMVNLILGDF